jgi:UDP-N-acetylmuramate dehydrogenase
MRAQDAQFGYRRSLIKRTPGRYAVLSVTFRLPHSPGSPALYAELAKKLDVEVGAVVPGPELRQAVLELRRAKGMVLDPRDPDTVSAGSFFTNPILDSSEFFKLQQRVRAQFGDGVAPPAFPSGTDGRTKTSAAWLIDRAGFDKGYGNPDGIAISGKHVLALTNRGQGTTAELVILAREIATAVWDTFGVRLVPEPVFAGHSW